MAERTTTTTAAGKQIAPVTTEKAAPEPEPTFDPRKMVRVVDTRTKEQLVRSVPETWLDGRFPHLTLAPSTDKEGR